MPRILRQPILRSDRLVTVKRMHRVSGNIRQASTSRWNCHFAPAALYERRMPVCRELGHEGERPEPTFKRGQTGEEVICGLMDAP